MSSNNKRGFGGAAITVLVCLLAVGGMTYAFLANSSPYVTIAQARGMSSDRLHLAGDIIKPTVHTDVARHILTFDLKDEKGDIVTVVYTGGAPPQNMGEATKVVAIGGMKDGKFVSNQLQVKCPSKYESQGKA